MTSGIGGPVAHAATCTTNHDVTNGLERAALRLTVARFQRSTQQNPGPIRSRSFCDAARVNEVCSRVEPYREIVTHLARGREVRERGDPDGVALGLQLNLTTILYLSVPSHTTAKP